MKLNGNDILKDVADKFAEQPNDFPRNGTVDYPKLIEGWIGKLNADVLPYVTAGAIAADRGGHLTMHDREHVERVRQVAADLIAQSESLDLSPFELTLLLIAVYLHDLGNVIGRVGHERNINQVLKVLIPAES